MESWFQSGALAIYICAFVEERPPRDNSAVFFFFFLRFYIQIRRGLCVIFIRYCRFITWLNQYSAASAGEIVLAELELRTRIRIVTRGMDHNDRTRGKIRNSVTQKANIDFETNQT